MGYVRRHLTHQLSELALRAYPSESAGVAAGLRAAVSVQLVVGDDVLGALTFRSRTPSAYTAGDMAMAERIAGQVAWAMARRGVGPDRGLESAELAALVEIGRLAGAGGMEDTLDAFAQQARRIVAFDWAILAAFDPEHGVSRVRSCRPAPPSICRMSSWRPWSPRARAPWPSPSRRRSWPRVSPSGPSSPPPGLALCSWRPWSPPTPPSPPSCSARPGPRPTASRNSRFYGESPRRSRASGQRPGHPPAPA